MDRRWRPLHRPRRVASRRVASRRSEIAPSGARPARSDALGRGRARRLRERCAGRDARSRVDGPLPPPVGALASTACGGDVAGVDRSCGAWSPVAVLARSRRASAANMLHFCTEKRRCTEKMLTKRGVGGRPPRTAMSLPPTAPIPPRRSRPAACRSPPAHSPSAPAQPGDPPPGAPAAVASRRSEVARPARSDALGRGRARGLREIRGSAVPPSPRHRPARPATDLGSPLRAASGRGGRCARAPRTRPPASPAGRRRRRRRSP